MWCLAPRCNSPSCHKLLMLLQSGPQSCVHTKEAQFSDQSPQLFQLSHKAAAGLTKMLLLRLHSLLPAACCLLDQSCPPGASSREKLLPFPCRCWQTQLDQPHPRLHPPLPLLQGSLRRGMLLH